MSARLVESRLTLTVSYLVLAVGAFIALFPIALLVLNSLKPAAARWTSGRRRAFANERLGICA